ncbi:MAG: hypothetical protein RML12_04720 [Xanthomonadales bacterium]|nr:hypothetical protein [Xanthomonadales bacterium]
MGRRAWLFALAFAVAKGAPAIEPETGLWWRAASPEWMLFLDRSGRDVVAVVIDRDAAGAPRWRLASGALSGAGFSAPLLAFRNGSCLTCPHRPPEVLATGLVLSFEAVSPVRGFLRIGDGPVEQVERLAFAGSHRGPRLLAGRGLDPALLPDPAGAWVVAGLEWRFGLPRWYGDLVLFAAPAVAEDGFGAEGEGRIDRPRWSFAGPDPDPPKPYRYRFGCRAQPGGALCDLVRWSEETPAETVFRWLSPLDFGTQAARLPLAALPPGVALHRLPTPAARPRAGALARSGAAR